MYLTLRACENISLRIADCLDFPLTAKVLEQSITTYNASTLKEIKSLNLHDFGIYLELEPDEEEKMMLEQNIQVALQSGTIDLDDAIDIRQIKNLKLANQQTAQQTALFEVQKQQALTQETINVERAKANFAIEKLQTEMQLKQQLLEQEFQYDMQLAQLDSQTKSQGLQLAEDRKDARTKIQATQQSELINQRNTNSLPTNFESSGFNGLEDFAM